ncbi:hypothetical protein EYR41_011915 [Orbilia oligospora]|uniref:Uncharacterized protein n=1 Tax=Orbilia oligospora TaxID=2813651 RepID=A0A8H2DPQ7_ORBOL|nr:hypothetical protein EYR41_011915 [Orbilia oligospora]
MPAFSLYPYFKVKIISGTLSGDQPESIPAFYHLNYETFCLIQAPLSNIRGHINEDVTLKPSITVSQPLLETL